MPVTRSASRTSLTAANERPLARTASAASATDPTETKAPKTITKRTKKRTVTEVKPPEVTVTLQATAPPVVPSVPPTFLPAVLSFSLEDAKQHLINADPRFEDIFVRLKCRPFEHLERVDPFRTLTTSILGQQISWLAARSIVHKFIRLFDPSMPEKPPVAGVTSDSDSFFPSAHQVCTLDIPTLRTAGLSGRKAEYVQDLAARFADGRLSNEKIFAANDDELYEMLVAVRGIGKWTVDMFAIFSLRRPDILPAGDLGVQRGLIRWILSLHSPKHTYAISPKKLPKAPTDNGEVEHKEEDSAVSQSQAQEAGASDAMDIDNDDLTTSAARSTRVLTPDVSSIPPAPLPSTPVTPVRGSNKGSAFADLGGSQDADTDNPMPPPAFTPSINRTLNKVLPIQYHPLPLPESLSVKELQTRLDGKKKVKGAMLTPNEMEELTESWKPYRSLGVYYMWALAEGKKAG